MQILGLLGMNFDAVVVEVKTFFSFIRIGSGHTVARYLDFLFFQTLSSYYFDNHNFCDINKQQYEQFSDYVW